MADTAIDDGPFADGVRLVRELGRGGFATVYLAEWCSSRDAQGREVAVKVAHSPADPRLLREAQAMRRVGPPSTPALLAEGTSHRERPYLIMEYVGRDTLAGRMTGRPWSPDNAVATVTTIAHALAGMHEKNVVHRDIKPDNILFHATSDATTRAVLIDLGLAHWRARPAEEAMAHRTRTGELTGTPQYMAPEQWKSPVVIDARTDLYALGVIFFELLTGRLPFVGELAQIRQGHVSGRCPRPSSLVDAARPWDEIVLRCLGKQLEDRFADVGDFLQALGRIDAKADLGDKSGSRDAASERVEVPVGLLALTSAAPATRVSAAVAARDVVLIRSDGERYLLGFPWFHSAVESVRATIEAARELVAELGATGHAVIHVASLQVRKRKRAVRLRGDAVRKPGRWDAVPATWPASIDDDVPIILLTETAARTLEPDEIRSLGQDWFGLRSSGRGARLADIDEASMPLLAREQLLDDLAMDADTCGRQGMPVLTTIVGDVGMGKSRLLRELAHRLHARFYGRIVTVQARPAGESDPDGLLRDLVLRLLELDGGDSVAAGIERKLDQLRIPADDPGRWAVRLSFGTTTRDEPALAPILGTPGALRQASARIVASILARVASDTPLFLLFDDVHLADLATLDAIEMATLARANSDITGREGPVHLAVFASARDEFWERRPRWGDRAGTGRRCQLSPIAEADAHTLLSAALRPAAFVPQAVLEHLATLGGGVPLYLVELARLVRNSAAMRVRTSVQGGDGSYYIAADEVMRVTSSNRDQELANRALAGLPRPLVPFAGLCALMGSEISLARVRGVQTVLEERASDDELLAVDAGVALVQLLRHGLLYERSKSADYTMRHPVLQQAIADAVPPSRRRALHAAIAVVLQRSERANRCQLADHAAHAGMPDVAAGLYLELAREAVDNHRYVEAEAHYSRGLSLLPDDTNGDSDAALSLRGQALAGRGLMRYRQQRNVEALDDLQRARELAEARNARVEKTTLLLAEVRVLDWCHRWRESAERVAEALAEVALQPMPHLTGWLQFARGLVHARRDEHHRAIEWLERSAEADEYETRVVSLLILGPNYCLGGQLEQARAAFATLEDLCRRVGDDFHLAVVYLNRQLLWARTGDSERHRADLERAAELGHRLGNAVFEYAATFNWAEFAYWHGLWNEAQARVERARELFLRYVSDSLSHDAHLLLARIACARGDQDAVEHVQWIDDNCDVSSLDPIASTLLEMVRQAVVVLAGSQLDEAVWTALYQRAEASPQMEEHVEVALMAVALLLGGGHRARARSWLARAREADSRLFQARIAVLARDVADDETDPSGHESASE